MRFGDKISWFLYLLAKYRYRHTLLRCLGWSREDCRRADWLLWRFRKLGWLKTLGAVEQLAAAGVKPGQMKDQLGKLFKGYIASGMIFEDYVEKFCLDVSYWGLK